MSIAILTPSRSRSSGLSAMLTSIRETQVLMSQHRPPHVYIGIDDDDPDTYDWATHRDVSVIRGPRQQLAGWTNTLADLALADGYEILASFGDDHRCRTFGWNMRVEAAMASMGPGLVYTADGLQNDRLPTAPFWHRSIIEAWGFYFFPSCIHLYADDYWLYAAKALGRCTYLDDVLIEHLHPASGKAKPDAINAENDSYYAKDGQAYALWLASPERRASLDRARAVL